MVRGQSAEVSGQRALDSSVDQSSHLDSVWDAGVVTEQWVVGKWTVDSVQETVDLGDSGQLNPCSSQWTVENGHSGQWTVDRDRGQGTGDSRLWTVDRGQRTLENSQWVVDSGQWTVDRGQ